MPDQPTEIGTTEPEAGTERLALADGGTGLWERVRADPGYAPELLALAAVRRWGPDAAREVGWLRATYPGATSAAVARYLQRRQVRRAGYGSVFAHVAGVLAPAAALATVLGSQARLVLGTAAAFGHDPAHPDRAAELLFLLGLQPDVATAATAVTAAQAGPAGRDSGPPAPLLRLAGLARTGGLAALPLRRLPGGRLVAAAVAGTAAGEKVARRAETLYRTRS